MFIPDVSVNSAYDDKLNRAPFAYKLADTIRDWKREESIVIGLFGPWGCGKTSILNFAVERLHETTKGWAVEKHPLIIWFNPWSFSEQEKLIQAFFQQVYAEVNKADPKLGKDLKKSIKKFAQVLGALEPIPVVGKILSSGGKFVELFITDKTLEETKKDVADIFRKLDRRIIILIDDIDRLNQEEIRLLFQLIKVNADFPNTMYLVAFDRPVVENALTDNSILGRVYLEKIVQVGFNVPDADPTLLQNLFFQELNQILNEILDKSFDKERWAKLYNSGFNTFFQTVRDIKRYINSLNMNIRMVKSEVDAIDFIGLEGLRVFLPEIYQGIAENKNLFTRPQQALLGHDPLLPALKVNLDSIFNVAKKQEEIAKNICIELFPALQSVYGNRQFSVDYWRLWKKQKRICHKDNFDVYFLLGTPKGSISHLEADEFLLKAIDEDTVIQQLEAFTRDSRLQKLFDRIYERLDNLSQNQIKTLCLGLMKFGDSVPVIPGGVLEFGSDQQIASLVRDLLINLPGDDRFNWFRAFLENKPPLYTMVYQVLLDLPRGEKKRDGYLFTEEKLKQLKMICVREIENRSKDDSFLQQKQLKFVLYLWKDWDPESPVRDAFVKSVFMSPEKSLDFLAQFLDEVRTQTFGNYFPETRKILDTKELYEFQTPEWVAEFINNRTEEDLSKLSEERLAIYNSLKEILSRPNNENSLE